MRHKEPGRRIIVIGTTGSGKSTLARAIAEKHGAPCTDLDDLHWLPGWKERPHEEFLRLADEATRGDSWVVAGNYTARVQPLIWPRADTLIWLDIPFWPNAGVLLKRTLRRALTKEEICNGNRESFVNQFFTRDSLLLWFLKSWGKNRRRYGDIFAHPQAYAQLQLIRLRSYAESAAFIKES